MVAVALGAVGVWWEVLAVVAKPLCVPWPLTESAAVRVVDANTAVLVGDRNAVPVPLLALARGLRLLLWVL